MELEKVGSEIVTKSNVVNACEIETKYMKLVDVDWIQEHRNGYKHSKGLKF